MKRWLMLMLLIAPSSGCAMLEDLVFGADAPPVYQYQATAEPSRGTCHQNVANVSASQTAEPELLQVKR